MKKAFIKVGRKLVGKHAGLSGDYSGLCGDCTGLSGNCNDVPMSVRPCELSEHAED